MKQEVKGKEEHPQGNANFAAAGLAGQIGCLVPAIILASVLGGMWLDRTFDTGHTITLILVLVSLPVSIYLTFLMAMRTVREMNQYWQKLSSGKPVEDEEDKKID